MRSARVLDRAGLGAGPADFQTIEGSPGPQPEVPPQVARGKVAASAPNGIVLREAAENNFHLRFNPVPVTSRPNSSYENRAVRVLVNVAPLAASVQSQTLGTGWEMRTLPGHSS